MQKAWLVALALVLVHGSPAVASPPSGRISFTDHTRATVVDGGTVSVPGGSEGLVASFTLDPGTASDPYTLPGAALLAITGGTLAVERSGGTPAEYSTGQAMVLPAGSYRLRNAGSGAARFVALFSRLAHGDPTPFASGGVASQDLGRGTFVPAGGYEGHGPPDNTFEVAAGKDVGVSFYSLEPGASVGCHTHTGPFVALKTRGTATYYEGHDGKYAPAGRFSTGDSWIALPDGNRRHLLTNEGSEVAEAIVAYLNMGRTYAGVPVLGQQLDSVDFRPLPPADCPRLR